MRWWLHIIFWLAICIWMTSVYLYNDVDFLPFLKINLVRLPFIILATYAVVHFVVRKQLVQPKPNYWKATRIFILIFLVASLVDRLIIGNPWLIVTLNGEPLYYKFFLLIPIAKNSFLLFSIMGVAAAIEFFRSTSKQKQEIHILKEEKLENELAFLKSQVNPHFLFNTFNNLYSMAVEKGDNELARGLSGVSQLMRYLTYESNVPRVSVKKEIELLQSFIDLQRLRVDNDEVSIVFRVTGEINNQVIAPVLLLPLVENAFKHGHKIGVSSWVSILVHVEKDRLQMDVKNKKHGDGNGEGGIGLCNLQKRLNLIYPDKHRLIINDEGTVFKVTLQIDFDNIHQLKPLNNDFLYSDR